MKNRAASHIKIGKPHVSISAPSHVKGVPQGNIPGEAQKSSGMQFSDRWATGSARRSTGINPEHRDPIDPKSPKLSPA